LEEGNSKKGNLYLGSVPALNNIEGLRERKIDCVLSVIDDAAYAKNELRRKI
jgi:hypothetical protein